MTDDELDKLSRASFPSANTVFEDKYWAQMEERLGGVSPKKTGFIFWRGIGALLIMVAAPYFFYNFNGTESINLESEYYSNHDFLTKVQNTDNTITKGEDQVNSSEHLISNEAPAFGIPKEKGTSGMTINQGASKNNTFLAQKRLEFSSLNPSELEKSTLESNQSLGKKVINGANELAANFSLEETKHKKEKEDLRLLPMRHLADNEQLSLNQKKAEEPLAFPMNGENKKRIEDSDEIQNIVEGGNELYNSTTSENSSANNPPSAIETASQQKKEVEEEESLTEFGESIKTGNKF